VVGHVGHVGLRKSSVGHSGEWGYQDKEYIHIYIHILYKEKEKAREIEEERIRSGAWNGHSALLITLHGPLEY
jgi:hypothetical protein